MSNSLLTSLLLPPEALRAPCTDAIVEATSLCLYAPVLVLVDGGMGATIGALGAVKAFAAHLLFYH